MNRRLASMILSISISIPVFHPTVSPGLEPPSPGGTLSLRDAVLVAAEHNPAIAAARARLEAAGEMIVQARSGLLPQLSFSQTFNRTTNPMFAFGTRLNQEAITQTDFDPARLNHPDPIDNFTTGFSAAWSIYDGGRTRAGVRQAEEGSMASGRLLERTRQEVIARTAVAYSRVLLARENLSMVRQTLETARTHLKMVESRFEGGFVVKSDHLRAQVRIAELEQQLLQAEGEEQIARAGLNAAMGIDIESDFLFPEAFETDPVPVGELDEWTGKALAGRPDFKALHHREAAGREEIGKARGAHFPSVNLVGSYELNSEDFGDLADNYAFGAIMNLSLFSGKRLSAREKEARALLSETLAIKRELSQAIRVETHKAFLQAKTSALQIEVARAAVNQAEEALRIVRNRYESGLFTILDLLNSEVSLQQARTNHFNAVHNYKVAVIALALAAGTLDADFN